MPASGNASPDGLELATIIFVPGLLRLKTASTATGRVAQAARWHHRRPISLDSQLSQARSRRVGQRHVGRCQAPLDTRQSLTNLVAKSRYAACKIDYRGLTEDDRARYRFDRQLSDSLLRPTKTRRRVPAPLPGDDTALTQANGVGATAWNDRLRLARDQRRRRYSPTDLPVDPAQQRTQNDELDHRRSKPKQITVALVAQRGAGRKDIPISRSIRRSSHWAKSKGRTAR
jgi:hypothetical protein